MAENIKAVDVGGINFDDAYGLCGSGELAGLYSELAGIGDFNGAKVEISRIDSVLSKDRIAKKMISVPVFDGLSNWRAASEKGNSDWLEIDNRLNTALHFQDAAEKARKYGLAVILPIIKDKNRDDVSLLQSIENIETGEIDRLVVIHEKIKPGEIQENISKSNFGRPISIDIGATKIDPSRLIFFGSFVEPTANSYFHSITHDLSEYHESKKRVQNAVRRNNSFVFEGNFENIRQFIMDKADATGQNIDINMITSTMARALHQNLNESNVAVINKGDKIHNFELNVIGDLLKNVDQKMQILSGISDVPLSRLFGKAIGGLTNSGQVDYENYSQSLDGWKAKQIEPQLQVMDSIISKVYGIEFSRNDWVWSPTRAEEIRLRLSGQPVEQGLENA